MKFDWQFSKQQLIKQLNLSVVLVRDYGKYIQKSDGIELVVK